MNRFIKRLGLFALMACIAISAYAFSFSLKGRQSVFLELQIIMDDELVPEPLWELSFYLDTLSQWGPAALDVSDERDEVVGLYNDWLDDGKTTNAVWTAQARDVYTNFFNRLDSEKELIFQHARESASQSFPYRVGVALDRTPPAGYLRDYALFNLRASRVGTQNFFSHKTNLTEQINYARGVLDDYEHAGMKVFLTMTPDPGVRAPEDLSFAQDLLPAFNKSFYPYGWNSKRRRDYTEEQYQAFAQELGEHPAVQEFKLGNEPFWSTGADHITGFDQAIVGCSSNRWQRQILDEYGTFTNWTAQFEPEISQSRYSAITTQVLTWASIGEVGISTQDVRGLTFVEFLKDKYGALNNLNEAWYGSETSRWCSVWGDVFPPIPETFELGLIHEEWSAEWADIPLDNDELFVCRPQTNDIPAWMDWVEFFPHCISNALHDGRAAVKAVNADIPVTCNSAGAHFLTDYRATAPLSMFPWIMTEGLDSGGIDFYVTGYCQPLLRAMTEKADGRPVHILESGGTYGDGPRGLDIDPERTTYMVLFAFAYGADTLLFWRQDYTLAPVLMHAICKATKALENTDLQENSVPITDRIALVYSDTSMRYTYAKWGDPYIYCSAFQASVAAANKLQLSYTVIDEKSLEDGIPDDIRVLIMPGATAVSEPFLEAVANFIARTGCRVITTDDFGSITEHGRPRTSDLADQVLDSTRTWHNAVTNLLDWRAGVSVGNSDALFWQDLDEPSWLLSWQTWVQAVAPRTVTYMDSGGNRDGSRAVAVRRSPDAMYVFVDPWAENISLQLDGNWSATDLYGGSVFPVNYYDGRVTVSGITGPAVIQLTPEDPSSVIAYDPFMTDGSADAANGIYQAGANMQGATVKGGSIVGFGASAWVGNSGLFDADANGLSAPGTGYALGGSVQYSGNVDDIIRSVRRPLDDYAGSSTFYVSMLMRSDTLQTTGTAYAGFNSGTDAFLTDAYGVFFGFAGTTGGMDLVLRQRQRLGAGVYGLTNTVLSAAAANTTYQLVAKVEVNTDGSEDAVSVWINPTSVSDIPVAVFGEGDEVYSMPNTNSISSVSFSARSFAGAVRFDEMRMGRSWSDVVDRD